MSEVGLILNLTLGALLVAALALGWRLERRLKALRDSQKTFTDAVADLDRAAARAEQGLADLRAATDEASETLAARIDRALAMTQRLDAGLARADRHVANATPAARPAADAAAAPELRSDLILEDAPAAPRRTPLAQRLQPISRPQRNLPPARPRPSLDDDLFAEPAPRAAGAAWR